MSTKLSSRTQQLIGYQKNPITYLEKTLLGGMLQFESHQARAAPQFSAVVDRLASYPSSYSRTNVRDSLGYGSSKKRTMPMKAAAVTPAGKQNQQKAI